MVGWAGGVLDFPGFAAQGFGFRVRVVLTSWVLAGVCTARPRPLAPVRN